MKLSAIVVDWKSAAHTARLVPILRSEAAAAGIPLEVVVVDNAPDSPGRAELSALAGSGVLRLVTPGGNTGFAGGLAAGVAASTGDTLLLANPDLLPARGSLAPLLDALGSADVAGPRFLWDEDGTFLLPPLFVPTLRGELARIRALAGDPEPLRRFAQPIALRSWEASSPLRVPALVGACLVLARALWERTGGFDGGYELFYEDTDWFRRLPRGTRSVTVPASRVVHLGGESTRHDPDRERKFLASEARYLSRRWCAPARMLRSLAARSRPAGASAEPLPPSGPPAVACDAGARCLVEISPFPTFFPSAGAFTDGAELRVPSALVRRLDPGDWWLRVTRLPDRVLLRSARFRAG